MTTDCTTTGVDPSSIPLTPFSASGGLALGHEAVTHLQPQAAEAARQPQEKGAKLPAPVSQKNPHDDKYAYYRYAYPMSRHSHPYARPGANLYTPRQKSVQPTRADAEKFTEIVRALEEARAAMQARRMGER